MYFVEEGNKSANSNEKFMKYNIWRHIINYNETTVNEHRRNEWNNEINVNNDYKDTNDICKWTIKCNINQNNLEELLNILRRNSYPNLPKCVKTFLFTNKVSYNIRLIYRIDGTAGEFIYFGIKKWLGQ